MASIAYGLCKLAVPLYLEDREPFGTRSWLEVVLSCLLSTAVCVAGGRYLLRRLTLLELLRCCGQPHTAVRDEAWVVVQAAVTVQVRDDAESGNTNRRKRSAPDLLFIAAHNGTVTLLAALAWLFRSPTLALHAFTLEFGYEVFDTLFHGVQGLEPETMIHHIVSPICILCSTQTDVDFRVLCHLCICIELSGAILGYSKFLLQYAHVSMCDVYRLLFYVYALLRVVLPLVDTGIIMHNMIQAGGSLSRSRFTYLNGDDAKLFSNRTRDFTQLYFWSMAMLNVFNIYFCCVIHARSRLNPAILRRYEGRTGCR
eukprot:NODE_13965_length_1136_cov_3.554014.p1 GENE.NODE_13965_length_1136_cov_3.554014~~NODE_13965_length_1136_cov_3.554014.p1  ORF type:complete len:313 (+),score=64.53 NODE_13965_length_1136_cov_3.554014:137-1075(+)